MANAGFGIIDPSTGAAVSKLEGDGDAKLGDSSGDLIQITGSVQINDNVFFLTNGRVGINTDAPDYLLDVAGDIGIDQYIYHNDDADTFMKFGGDAITFKAGNISFINLDKKAAAPHEFTVNDGSNNIDLVVKGNGSNKGNPLFKCDASTGRVGINGVGSPSVELEVDGTIKGDYYITTPSTQDLGSGTTSTLSIGSSLMFLDADSITGVDMGLGMDVHTLTLPNGTTSGQRLTLIVEGNMGAGNNVPIMIAAGNILGVSDFLMPGAKTSLNFVYYSTAAISAWYQV